MLLAATRMSATSAEWACLSATLFLWHYRAAWHKALPKQLLTHGTPPCVLQALCPEVHAVKHMLAQSDERRRQEALWTLQAMNECGALHAPSATAVRVDC